MAFLEFIFSGFWIFIGFALLVNVVIEGVVELVKVITHRKKSKESTAPRMGNLIFRDECGFTAEVELVEKKQNDKGTSITFRIIKIYTTPDTIPEDELPQVGETLSVWKSLDIKRDGWWIEGL